MLLWRLSEASDPLVGKSVLTNYTHHQPLQKVCWVRVADDYLIASVATDGKMLLWAPSNMTRPLSGFRLLRPKGQSNLSIIEGATSIGFSPLDPSTFVAGLEGGAVLKGSLAAKQVRSVSDILRMPSELPWSHEAAALMTRVPVSHFHRWKTRIERDAVLARAREVGSEHVLGIEPDLNVLFQSPISFEYEVSKICRHFCTRALAAAPASDTVSWVRPIPGGYHKPRLSSLPKSAFPSPISN